MRFERNLDRSESSKRTAATPAILGGTRRRRGPSAHRIIGVPVAPLAAALERLLAAAGVTALVLVAIDTSDLSALQWTAGAVLGTGGFVGCRLVSRELSLGEFRLLASRRLKVLRANR